MNIADLINKYHSLNLQEVIDHERFNEYAIVHHSSAIEGSTLTENETRLLIEEGTTPKGKPLEHSLMVKDHFEALRFTLREVRTRKALSVEIVQSINAAVLKSTGSIYNTALGMIDASKGQFRKENVSAGGSYFLSYDKVERYTYDLVKKINEFVSSPITVEEKVNLSFSAHFDLVTIHPFYDGNGRTSRLLMNYLQEYFKLPLAIVFKEDKADYFEALQLSRKNEDTQVFIEFMTGQYTKHLSNEITLFEEMNKGIDQKHRRKNGPGFSLFY